MQREIKKLEDQFAQLRRDRERLRGTRRHREDEAKRHEFPELEELERRIRHIHAAAENLEQAGQHDLARELHEKAEQMQRELHRELQERERSAGRNRDQERPPLDEVVAAIKELRSEVQRLRNEVKELRELLKVRAE